MAGLSLRIGLEEERRLHANASKNVSQSQVGNSTTFTSSLGSGPSFRPQVSAEGEKRKAVGQARAGR